MRQEAGFIVVAGAMFASLASAQEWPSKPIRIVQPFAPGAATQVVAQDIGEQIAKATGGKFIVEPKPGAGGNIGTEAVARAAPDGHTLLLGSTGTHTVNVALYRKLNFDPVKDFVPITLLCDLPNVLVVSKDAPFQSVKDFVAAAKSKPKTLNYGSSGGGTSMHLAGEQFRFATGIDIVHVPFKESSQALTALLGGQIEATFHQLPAVVGQIRSGALKGLAVTSKTRSPVAPNVPTVAESGYPGFDSVSWYALFAPAGTPKPIVDRLNEIVTAALRGETGKRMEAIALTPRPSTPGELADLVARDTVHWRGIVERIGAKVD